MSQDCSENNPLSEECVENTNSSDSESFRKILFDLSNKRRELAIVQDQCMHSRVVHWFTLVTGICTALYLNSSFDIKCTDSRFGFCCFYYLSLAISWTSAIFAAVCLFNSERIRDIKQSALMRKWIDWIEENNSLPDFDVEFIETISRESAKDEEEWENLFATHMKWLKYAQYCTAVSLVFLFFTIFFKIIIGK